MIKSIQTLLCIIGIFLSTKFLRAHPPEESDAEDSPQGSTTEEVEVISIDEQPWYEAADKAVAREFASPRNSRAQHISVADIIIPGGVKVVPHKHAWEEVYIITAGRGQMMVEDSKPNEVITYNLQFIKPWKSTAKVNMQFSEAEKGTKLTWNMDSS
ncbi:MAG: hypothetical protein AAGB06_06840, partial [Verrucomicrobiota bacterium]